MDCSVSATSPQSAGHFAQLLYSILFYRKGKDKWLGSSEEGGLPQMGNRMRENNECCPCGNKNLRIWFLPSWMQRTELPAECVPPVTSPNWGCNSSMELQPSRKDALWNHILSQGGRAVVEILISTHSPQSWFLPMSPEHPHLLGKYHYLNSTGS